MSYEISLPFLAEADAEAAQRGDTFIAPEHLLLAVVANSAGASRTFFARHDLTTARLREAVAAVYGARVQETTSQGPRTIALRALRALAHAIEAATQRGARGLRFTADELLTALLSDDVARGAVIGAVLERFDISVTSAQVELAELRAAESREEEIVPSVTIGDLQQEIDRVKVDMRRARVRLRDIDRPVLKSISHSEHEEVHTVDLLPLMQTLRSLPDGAGTSAFVKAYAERTQGRT